MLQETSCGTIVFRKGGEEIAYLLLQYPAGHWDFPKGHVEAGETEEATALRELEEESGLTNVHIFPGFREEITYYYKKRGKTVLKTVWFFLVETQEQNITISHEHTGFDWVPFEPALKKLTFENARQLLKKAHRTVGAAQK